MVKVHPRIFMGEQDSNGDAEDPRTWLSHFEKVCRPNNWNMEEEKMTNFMVYLQGEAEDWYDINTIWIENTHRT